MNELFDYLTTLTKNENCPIKSVYYVFQDGPLAENYMLITMKNSEEIKCRLWNSDSGWQNHIGVVQYFYPGFGASGLLSAN